MTILYNRQKRETKCYYQGRNYAKGLENQATQDGYYGWCGVCLKNASMQDYGYCNTDHTQPGETFGKTTRAKRAKDWGFCSPLCDIQSQSHRLMELNWKY